MCPPMWMEKHQHKLKQYLLLAKMSITDCCLYRHDIPVELRRIVHQYSYQPLDNKSIRVAVKMWENEHPQALHTFGHISHWNTSGVTNMSGLFCKINHQFSIHEFNEDISQWDVSNVTDMSCMFTHTSKFNQPLNNWNVSNVTRLDACFQCSVFNQPLDK